MKTVINGHEVEGTPEEIARMIGLTPDENRVATNATIDFGNNSDWGFAQKVCRNCSNHPQNGGNGICNCVLGVATIY